MVSLQFRHKQSMGLFNSSSLRQHLLVLLLIVLSHFQERRVCLFQDLHRFLDERFQRFVFLVVINLRQVLPILGVVLAACKHVQNRLDERRPAHVGMLLDHFVSELTVQLENLSLRVVFARPVVDLLIYLSQLPGVLVGRAANHAAVERMLLKKLLGMCDRLDSSIQCEVQLREVLLEAIDVVVLERWHYSVLGWGKAVEDCVSRMHDEVSCLAVSADLADEVVRELIVHLVINSQPALHCARNVDCSLHRCHAFSDERRLLHQACTEGARLNSGTRAADVQIDFVVAQAFGNFRSFHELIGIAASQLYHNGVLYRVVLEHMAHLLFVIFEYGVVVNHLGVESGLAGQQPQEVPTVCVGDVDHRCYAEQRTQLPHGFHDNSLMNNTCLILIISENFNCFSETVLVVCFASPGTVIV